VPNVTGVAVATSDVAAPGDAVQAGTTGAGAVVAVVMVPDEPDVAASGAPNVAAPGAPDVAAPGAPDVAAPGVAAPNVATPGKPDVAAPGVAVPDGTVGAIAYRL
jgi:hypothetical protein